MLCANAPTMLQTCITQFYQTNYIRLLHTLIIYIRLRYYLQLNILTNASNIVYLVIIIESIKHIFIN